ncbi:MAG: hypothetical protein DRP11_04295 [Candidatus Aenigmatarchaeota archaeon]|nr:MAG: hypothetical protein DRP11_04295 [Candidatus Aenigmarchaeota archaeon]
MLKILNMNESTVKKLNVLITAMVGVAIGLSIAQGNYLITLIVVIAGLATIRFISNKARTKGIVLEDERLELTTIKASDKTFRVVTVVLVTFGFVLKALNNVLGDTLLYIGCLMLIVYLVFYRYYASKLGGV